MPRAKGERRLEILKALAQMLEQPKWERITTAALAEKLDVSEAALYRHFASKAQMYEGLIEFIESSVFTLANKITADEADGDAAGRAATLLRYSIGCLHQYAKSGFARKPTESFSAQRRYLLS